MRFSWENQSMWVVPAALNFNERTSTPSLYSTSRACNQEQQQSALESNPFMQLLHKRAHELIRGILTSFSSLQSLCSSECSRRYGRSTVFSGYNLNSLGWTLFSPVRDTRFLLVCQNNMVYKNADHEKFMVDLLIRRQGITALPLYTKRLPSCPSVQCGFCSVRDEMCSRPRQR